MKTVLLTLGRLPVALDIARSFARSGWRVIVAEPWAMHLARTSSAVTRCIRVTPPADDPDTYLAELASIVESERVDLIVPVSEESMHVAALRECAGRSVPVFCMGQPEMLALHDKYRFTVSARRFGLRVPDSCLASDPDRQRITAVRPFVSKPRFSCSGRDVAFHPPGTACEPSNNIVLQERLIGDLYSSFSIAREGRILASTAYRGTLVDGSVAVAFQRVVDTPGIDRWTAEFVRQSRHTGFIAFDFVGNADREVAAIECNPRATSGIHFLRSDVLASAIAGKNIDGPVYRHDEFLTESYSALTVTLASLCSRKDFRRNLGALRQARDVTWLPSDPWPYLSMMFNSYRIVTSAFFARQSFAAAAVLDIEWHGPVGD